MSGGEEWRPNTQEERAAAVTAAPGTLQRRARFTGWSPVSSEGARFDFDTFQYRVVVPQPVATLRPWTLDEVPLDAWFKRKNGSVAERIVAIDSESIFNIHFERASWYSLEGLFKDFEWSHNPITGPWNECGTMEEK